jgi:hypothetical protein
MQKKLQWSGISEIKASSILETYKKESTVIDWEITPKKNDLVDLTISVDLPQKKNTL